MSRACNFFDEEREQWDDLEPKVKRRYIKWKKNRWFHTDLELTGGDFHSQETEAQVSEDAHEAHDGLGRDAKEEAPEEGI